MAQVAVTILSTTPDDFAARLDRIKHFATRIHIDASDGVLAPGKTIGLAQAYGLEGVRLDLHLMLEHPADQIETALSLNPSLIIFHAEAEGDLLALINQCKEVGIGAGIALKSDTAVEEAKHLIAEVDHALIFTGTLGSNGGDFQGAALDKIRAVKAINPAIEVGVDGGLNMQNARLALQAGADVLDVGSYVHNATDPEAAYIELDALAKSEIS